MEFEEFTQKSKVIRDAYHKLEKKHHGREWTVEEDALAFTSDVGLISRYVMDKADIWPATQREDSNLAYKIGESVWWLAVLAERTDLDFEEAIELFINKKLTDFK